MERLTKRDEDGYMHKIGECSLIDCYNKLGRLENIEDELGVSLEVLFKALKNGIYRFYEEFEDEPPYIRFADVSIGYDEDNNTWVFECSNLDIYDLKDYGVTWALTREELIKNEEKLQP